MWVRCVGFVTMSSSCAVSGSIIMPWKPTVTLAMPLGHAYSPLFRPQVPGYLTSCTAQLLCIGGDGSQRDGVERRWDE
jgi:hypothetical protein